MGLACLHLFLGVSPGALAFSKARRGSGRPGVPYSAGRDESRPAFAPRLRRRAPPTPYAARAPGSRFNIMDAKTIIIIEPSYRSGLPTPVKSIETFSYKSHLPNLTA